MIDLHCNPARKKVPTPLLKRGNHTSRQILSKKYEILKSLLQKDQNLSDSRPCSVEIKPQKQLQSIYQMLQNNSQMMTRIDSLDEQLTTMRKQIFSVGRDYQIDEGNTCREWELGNESFQQSQAQCRRGLMAVKKQIDLVDLDDIFGESFAETKLDLDCQMIV